MLLSECIIRLCSYPVRLHVRLRVLLNLWLCLRLRLYLALQSTYQKAIWVEVSLNKNDTLLVGCIYRSPGSSDENNQKLNDIISEAKNHHHTHFMLLGDFNYPNIVWDDACATGSGNAAESKFYAVAEWVRAQVSKSRGPGFESHRRRFESWASSLPHVALASQGRF